jgi:hypothetical protein
VDAGHPHNERLRILKRPTTLAGIHPGEMVIPPIDEVKREIERTTLDPVFIIYTPVASIGVRAPPRTFLGMKGRAGRPASSAFGSKDKVYATQRAMSRRLIDEHEKQ